MVNDAQRVLFSHRYLLSPTTTPEAFAIPALRQDMERLLRGLQSSAAPLVEQFGIADLTGAFPVLIETLIGASQGSTLHGVWFATDRQRALVLATTRAGAMDVEAQELVGAALQQAFAAADPGGAGCLPLGQRCSPAQRRTP